MNRLAGSNPAPSASLTRLFPLIFSSDARTGNVGAIPGSCRQVAGGGRSVETQFRRHIRRHARNISVGRLRATTRVRSGRHYGRELALMFPVKLKGAFGLADRRGAGGGV